MKVFVSFLLDELCDWIQDSATGNSLMSPVEGNTPESLDK
jgi:hypothetical protein